MINRHILKKCYLSFPLIISQRYRVRNLPKERYEDNETPMFKKRKPVKSFTTDIFAFLNKKHSVNSLIHYAKWKEIEEMREDQMYLTERHTILGPNLATAHFICVRGGRVKFKGSDKWITQYDIKNNLIPNTYVPDYFIEEVDASGTSLCYEGFENLSNLTEFKKLILQNCPFIDDWCLSRSHLFANSLQYLDLSSCKNITERGICALHVLKKLKTLVLHDTPNIQNRELVLLLLQDVLPKLKIVGVDFQDPVLLQRLEKYNE